MSEQVISKLLRIDTRGRDSGAMTRFLGDQIEARLQVENPGLVTLRRELDAEIPLLDDAWIDANLTPADQRTPQQVERLRVSDQLIGELQASDGLLITVPMHNFSIPGVLKAWIDQVCRAGLTFRYTANGPQGLLADRPTYVAIATGGVPLGSPVDYLSDYLLQVLGFIGITQVQLISAERVNMDSIAAATTAIAQLDQVLPQTEMEAIA